MAETSGWTEHETALWWTCQFGADISDPEKRKRPAVPVSFAMRNGTGEYVYQWGAFQRSEFGVAPKVAQKSKQSTGFLSSTGELIADITFGSSGALGADVLMSGAKASRVAVKNKRNQSQAQADAVPAWRALDSGNIYLTDFGYYIESDGEILPYPNGSIIKADMVSAGVIDVTHNMAGGKQRRFALNTIWAELIFVSWAARHCSGHPQFPSLGWLPPEFVARVQASRAWTDPRMPALMPPN
jgi:hypothetical protein